MYVPRKNFVMVFTCVLILAVSKAELIISYVDFLYRNFIIFRNYHYISCYLVVASLQFSIMLHNLLCTEHMKTS